MYAVQQQALGSIQWTIIASCLKQTTYTITNLSKGVRYAFRVLSITNKAFSKPSPATDPVQLLDRGILQQTRTATVREVNKMYELLQETGFYLSVCRSVCPGGSCNHWQAGHCVYGGKAALKHHSHSQPCQCISHMEAVFCILIALNHFVTDTFLLCLIIIHNLWNCW